MLIAFVGSRGSGKTTIAEAFYRELDKRNVRYTHQASWREQAGFFARAMSSIWLWRHFDWSFIRMYAGPSLYRLYFPLTFAYNLTQLSTKKTDVLVYDTDILFPFVKEVQKGTFNANAARSFVEKSILTKAGRMLIVVVDTPPDEALYRWQSRDNLQMNAETKSDFLEKRGKRRQALETVVEALGALPQVKVLHLDGARSPNENARLIITDF